MKKILLVGLLGLTFFENIQSAGMQNAASAKIIAYGLTDGDKSPLPFLIKGLGLFHNLAECIQLREPKMKWNDLLPTSSAVMVTPSVLAQKSEVLPYVATESIVRLMDIKYGPAVPSRKINRHLVKDFVAENSRFFALFYRSGFIKFSNPVQAGVVSIQDELNPVQEKALVDALVPLYENYNSLDKAIKKVLAASSTSALASVNLEAEKLQGEIDPTITQAILLSAREYKKITEEAVINSKINNAQNSAVVLVDVAPNIRILATGSEVPGLKAAMERNITAFEQASVMKAVDSVLSIQDSQSISDVAIQIEENRQAIEEIKEQAEEELQKNPTADVADLIPDISFFYDKLLPVERPKSLVNDDESLTNGFLEGVRDFCLPKVVELAGTGSNHQIMEKFQREVLDRGARFTSEQRAYMLGYFQNCLWQVQNDQSNPFDQNLLNIVEITRALYDDTKNNVRG